LGNVTAVVLVAHLAAGRCYSIHYTSHWQDSGCLY